MPNYVAELHRETSSDRSTLESKVFEAESDKAAISMALEWATEYAGTIGGLVRLQVVQRGRTIFSKVYGE